MGVRKHMTDDLWVDIAYVYTKGNDAPIEGTGYGDFGLLEWHSNTVGIFLGVRPKAKS